MSEPLRVGVGVLCEVVDGLQGDRSPNLGLIVRVTKFIGYHETYGPIWESKNEYGERPEYSKVHRPIDPGHQDYAESWLRPIPGQSPPGETNVIDSPVIDTALV